jgi:succinoglycan biosynthesis protein ExoA
MNDLTAPAVSVILPILNEEQDLENCISAILQQDYAGEIEIILALGPSKDKTNQIADFLAAKNSNIKLVNNPSGQTAKGLNLAIKESSNEIICRIDGHSEISSTYIKTAVEIMLKTGAVNVGGVMYADSSSGLQRTIAQAMRSKLGVGLSKFHTGGSAGESETVYLGTFKKAAILKAGGFDERYIRAQDWELNHRMRAQGGLIWFDPSLKVTYGRWRRVIARQHPKTTNYRYLAPPLAVIANTISLIAGVFINPILFVPFISYVILLVIGGLIIGQQVLDKFFMPLVLATMHISWGMGFLTSPKKLFKG